MRARAAIVAVLAWPMLLGAARAGVGDDFRHGLSAWVVQDEGGTAISARGGVLDIDAPKGVTLWLRQPLTGPVAIEYDVRPVAAGGRNDKVSDVNAFWMASDPAVPGGSALARPRTGAFADYDDLRTYYVGIGGNRNTTTRFRRYIGVPGNRPLLPEHDRSDPADMLVANRWIHLRLIADGAHIAVERDGQPLFSCHDPSPYRIGRFGLRTTWSHLQIRRLRVTRVSYPTI